MDACSTRENTSVINSVQIFNCIVTVPTSVTATLANILVLISIWRTTSLHLPSNIFLVGLSLSDFGVGLMVQPMFFAYNWTKLKHRSSFCVVATAHSVIGYCFCGVSLLTLTAIALDKYIAIRFHLRYQELLTTKRVGGILVLTWLGCALVSTSYLWNRAFLDFCAAVTAFVSFNLTIFAYCKIYVATRRHQSQIQIQLQAIQGAQQRDSLVQIARHRKSALNALLVYCLFLSSYIPYAVASVVHMSNPSAAKMAALELTTLWVHINSTLNPFLYCWRFRQIRAAVIETVRHFSNVYQAS